MFSEDATRLYGNNTTGFSRIIAAALLPKNLAEVVEIVKIAGDFNIPVYPVSPVQNLGFGSSTPIRENCVVVDLSKMNKIRIADRELGYFDLEPGVTSNLLYHFFQQKKLPYLVPSNDFGPQNTLLANVVDRGMTITPPANHFFNLMAIQAVLTNGEIYESLAFTRSSGRGSMFSKWGVGPHLDGLFTQSNFGIITKVRIACTHFTECMEPFSFQLETNASLAAAIKAMKKTLNEVGEFINFISMANAPRVLVATHPGPLEREQVAKLCKEYRLAAWSGQGVIYASEAMVGAVRRVIKENFAGICNVQFFSSQVIERIKRSLPLAQARSFQNKMAITAGRPDPSILQLFYWNMDMNDHKNPDPDRDGCGLLWYVPLVPLTSRATLQYNRMVHKICGDYDFLPAIILTSLTAGILVCGVPLLFDRSRSSDIQRAHQCYNALVEEGVKYGFFPYRMASHAMPLLLQNDAPFWNLASRLRQSAGREGIIAPGRYSNS